MILCGHELRQEAGLFPLTQDSVLLAAFAAPRRGTRVLDLGAGQGFLGVLLESAAPCAVDGLERDGRAAAVARENYAIAGCRGRIWCAPWDGKPAPFPAGGYALCVSNPPYFAAGSGPAGTQAAARQAARGGEEGLCAAAFRALKTGGRFCLSLPPARLASYIAALRRARLEPKRLLPVCPRAGTAPTLLLLESRREGGEGLRFLPPLILQTRTGAPTAALRRIYDPQARKRGPERSEP